MKKLLLVLALGVASATATFAATATLSVPTMYCAACPITVKKALMKVKGVSAAEVSFEKKQAVVSFDETQTNPVALMKATENAGFPSTAK